MDASRIFAGLATPGTSGTSLAFCATPVKSAAYRLAKDAFGCPALLISLSGRGSVPTVSAPFRLKHLEVLHECHCRLERPGAPVEEATFTLIRCVDSDERVKEYFLRVLPSFMDALGAEPSRPAILSAVDSFVELFRALSQPAKKSMRGLWAELLILAEARDVVPMLNSWHSRPDERYDFADGLRRIEVKSSALRERRHMFALEQLRPANNCSVLVASVFVEPSGGGTSAAELIDRIRRGLASEPRLAFRLEEVVTLTLGRDCAQAISERFDIELARDSLSFYDARSIPAVPTPLPVGIADVHFRADLSGCVTLKRSEVAALGGLFAAAVAQ